MSKQEPIKNCPMSREAHFLIMILGVGCGITWTRFVFLREMSDLAVAIMTSALVVARICSRLHYSTPQVGFENVEIERAGT